VKNVKKVSDMTKEERVAELKRLFTTPENKLRPKEFKTFNELWERINELVGRSTMTHELAFPDLLYEEILSGKLGNPLGESLIRATQLTKGKKAIIVTPNQDPDLPGTPLGFKIVRKVDLSKEKEV
jgi:hypothetical protein